MKFIPCTRRRADVIDSSASALIGTDIVSLKFPPFYTAQCNLRRKCETVIVRNAVTAITRFIKTLKENDRLPAHFNNMGDIPFLNCRRISPDAIGFLRENEFISDASGAICFVLGKQSYLGRSLPFY
ncbi:hypothetical protein CEXT_444361 [Caerostris extrusa]|uniref:Uncharacterized protein n=1 Tax=Caerostris extrusa TaxID=172846 RepID=A0AAV4XK89_CAEEX|nr:hypothetical protein CEXT_444361 [Caerostris extrusa]